MICPGFDRECRFCSNGVSIILKDVYNILTHKKEIKRIKTPVRAYCNNHNWNQSGWIDEMQVCYMIWSRYRNR
jgi:hypothetical protein